MTRGAMAVLGGIAVAFLVAACAPERAVPGDPATTGARPRSACPDGALDGPYLAQVPGNGAHDPLLLERAVLHAVNTERCRRGVAPLGPDRALGQAAQLHARDMVRLGLFAHDLPVQGRETIARRLDTVGVRYRRAAENIAEGFFLAYEDGRPYREVDPVRCLFQYADGTRIERHSYASLARDLVTRWMDSTGHRQNILNQGMRRHGFAIVPVGDRALCGRLYASQAFAD